MTSVLDPSVDRGTRRPAVAPPARVATWGRAHARSAAYVVPLLAAVAAARLVGLDGRPAADAAETALVERVWSQLVLGGPGAGPVPTDWTPLGRVQVAAWARASDAFSRWDAAVAAGREAMVVCAVLSAGLLWLLARRLGLRRPAAAGAVLLAGVSPVAVELGRPVQAAAVALPWLLASCVLAASRRHQLPAFAAAGACLAVAVLTEDALVWTVPLWAWLLWRSSEPATRRYTLSVATTVAVLTALLVLALTTPGWPPLPTGAPAGPATGEWTGVDAVLPAAGLVAALVVLVAPPLRTVRPLSAIVVGVAAAAAVLGVLPVAWALVALPCAALSVAAMLDELARRGRQGAVGAAVGATALAVAVLVRWPAPLQALWQGGSGTPLADARAWTADVVRPGERVLVDDEAWLDLVRAGLPAPALVRLSASGGGEPVDADYVLVTDDLRRAVPEAPAVGDLLDQGVQVARFGSGSDGVQVVLVPPGGAEAYVAAAADDALARRRAGRELAGNAALTLSDDAAATLRSGEVDARLLALVARFSAAHDLRVDGFPVVPGEEGNGLPRRTLAVGTAAGDAASLDRDLRALGGPLAGAEVERDGDAFLVRYPLATAPDQLLPAP